MGSGTFEQIKCSLEAFREMKVPPLREEIVDLFHPAEEEVYKLMMTCLFSRFRQQPEYSNFLRKHPFGTDVMTETVVNEFMKQKQPRSHNRKPSLSPRAGVLPRGRTSTNNSSTSSSGNDHHLAITRINSFDSLFAPSSPFHQGSHLRSGSPSVIQGSHSPSSSSPTKQGSFLGYSSAAGSCSDTQASLFFPDAKTFTYSDSRAHSSVSGSSFESNPCLVAHSRVPTMDGSWRIQETPRASDISVKGGDQKSKLNTLESPPNSLQDRSHLEGKVHSQVLQKSQQNQDLQATSSSQQQQQPQLPHGEPIIQSQSLDYQSLENSSERSREKSFESTAAHTPQDVFLPRVTEGDEEQRSSHSSRESEPRSPLSPILQGDETRSSGDGEPSPPFPLRDSAANDKEADLIPGVALRNQ